MTQDTGIFIMVPEDIADKVLREGYCCSQRKKVPASNNIEAATRAYRRHQRSRPPVLLRVDYLPQGVTTRPSRHKDGTQKDGIKLQTDRLPPHCLSKVVRGHSVPSSFASASFQPPSRATSTRAREPVDRVTLEAQDGRYRVVGRQDIRQLYHATSNHHAQSILAQNTFHPGTRGFLGPGIYFSETPSNARRYCQCRTRPHVVLSCRVNVGNMKVVPQRRCTAEELLIDGCDCFKEDRRDCIMLPNMDKKQVLNIEMSYS